MPKKLEQKLKRQGKARGFTGRRLDRFVFGTMNKRGFKPKRSGTHHG